VKNSKLRVAVTGLSVSQGILANYLEAPETELVLIQDIDESRAKETSKRFGNVPWTTDFTDILRSDADMVDVSTPNQLHAEQSIAALKSGKHVLCQKPMARDVAECKTMIAAAKRAKKTLGVAMGFLGSPLAPDLKRIISEGYLGKIAAVHIRNAHRAPYHCKGRHGWRASEKNVGGGSFMQLTVHSLNFALWLLDDDVVRVSGYSKNLYCRHSIEGEDVTAAAGELQSGALITMESGYSSVGSMVAIYGTEGHFVRVDGHLFIELPRDFKGAVLKYRYSKSHNVRHFEIARDFKNIPKLYKETNQQRAFARAVLGGKKPPVPGETGMRDVAIIQAIYESAKRGKSVTVKEMLK